MKRVASARSLRIVTASTQAASVSGIIGVKAELHKLNAFPRPVIGDGRGTAAHPYVLPALTHTHTPRVSS